MPIITVHLIKELQCKLLLYLDCRRYLIEMNEQCNYFLESITMETINKFPPVRYIFEVDVMDLSNMCPELGELLIKEPMKFQIIMNDILHACILSTDNDLNKYITYDQVGVNVRLKCVPQLCNLNPQWYRGIVTFEGLLISFSKPESYVYHSVWCCPEECVGNEVIRQYIPKVPPKCTICKSVLFENSAFRCCGEKVVGTLKLKDNIQTKRFILVDDLKSKLTVGSTYVLHVIITKKVTIVWSVKKVVPLAAPITTPIPKDIEQLHNACGGLPWKFIYCLASSIGVNVCPLNCFMHLKISLLISLVSIKANAIAGTNIVHVLVASVNTRFIGDLMEEAAKLADRSVSLGTNNTVASTAMIASSGGVCIMPLPLHVYNHKHISSVLSAIETGEVNTGTNMTKLKTAVWAQGSDFKNIILNNVASVFGNVCRGDYGDCNDELAEFILQQAVEPVVVSKEETKALRDVAKYIDLVAGIEVVLGEESESLLQSYFLAARKERPRGVSVNSMTTLVSTCLTSARLCRRRATNIDDAVLAIWLHVGGCQEPRFAPDEYLQTPADVRKLKTVITNFKDWLEQFTADYCV